MLAKLYKKILLNYLGKIQYGSLIFVDQETLSFPMKKNTIHENDREMYAEIHVEDPRFYRYAVLRQELGIAEAYVLGYWTSPNLTAVFRLFLNNREALDSFSVTSFLASAKQKWELFRHRNTFKGSQKNISAHYDLSNDLYQLFLDKKLMYSSAVFSHEHADLDEAAEFKLKQICDKLKLNENDHIIEIGTGWGGFAVYAVQNYGCHVTTTTISKKQYDYACALIKRLHLEDKITVLFEDYRNLEGQYDKLVSIEMIEAVGYQYFDQFFSKCSELLKPSGQMFLQAIVMNDQEYERSKNNLDFIKKYIFPGSCLPSKKVINECIAEYTNLKLWHLDDIGLHYAKTLKLWCDRFNANAKEVLKIGFSEDFLRLWNYYFSYCEAGFAERYISDLQLFYIKPHAS